MMRKGFAQGPWIGILGAVTFCCGAMPVLGALETLGGWFRPDETFPQFDAFWHEGWNEPEEMDEARARFEGVAQPPGGAFQVFVRNSSAEAVRIEDVALQDVSLAEALVFSDQRRVRKFASIYYAELADETYETLLAAGEPVWWKADPVVIPAGGVGVVTVRLRSVPTLRVVELAVRTADGATRQERVPVRLDAPRVAGAFFSDALDTVYLYFRHRMGGAAVPSRILVDGRDVTARARVGQDAGVDVVPVVVQLEAPLARGSVHLFQGLYADGSMASAALRAWRDEFAYGMWGGPGGRSDDAALARRYITDITDRNINVQMVNVASPAVANFLKSDAGQRFATERGLRAVLDEAGKWGFEDPYLCFIHDEPDCADYRSDGLPDGKQVGALAQWCVQRSGELRAAVPQALQVLNLDMTFKPSNWYIYGLLPDVLSVDPYYQARLRGAYWKDPHRLSLYAQATYVYAVSRVARSACEPNPLHVILYACDVIDARRPEGDQRFRFPTPQEKRIEAYYAVAAGAKGLSYWWYTPSRSPGEKSTSYGIGAATIDGVPEAQSLWREIGLLGAEMRTAGPVIGHSCAVQVNVEATEGVWTHCLLAGLDTMVLLAVNQHYANDRVGTVHYPIEDAELRVAVPAWLEQPTVFEIASDGTRELETEAVDAGLAIPLGTLDLTRMIVMTSDAQLRSRLEKVYRTEFADKVSRLRREGR